MFSFQITSNIYQKIHQIRRQVKVSTLQRLHICTYTPLLSQLWFGPSIQVIGQLHIYMCNVYISTGQLLFGPSNLAIARLHICMCMYNVYTSTAPIIVRSIQSGYCSPHRGPRHHLFSCYTCQRDHQTDGKSCVYMTVRSNTQPGMLCYIDCV